VPSTRGAVARRRGTCASSDAPVELRRALLIGAVAALLAGSAAAAILVLVPEDAPDEVAAAWIDFRSVPADVQSGEQPAQGADGVMHEVRRCSVRDGDLETVVDFDNPYDRPLRSVVALSVDGESEGLVWGWFRVRLPPGEARVVWTRGARRPGRGGTSARASSGSPTGSGARPTSSASTKGRASPSGSRSRFARSTADRNAAPDPVACRCCRTRGW